MHEMGIASSILEAVQKELHAVSRLSRGQGRIAHRRVRRSRSRIPALLLRRDGEETRRSSRSSSTSNGAGSRKADRGDELDLAYLETAKAARRRWPYESGCRSKERY